MTIDKYIELLKEKNIKIELIEITLNEIGNIDIKLKGKEKEEG